MASSRVGAAEKEKIHSAHMRHLDYYLRRSRSLLPVKVFGACCKILG
jgi:hypothetical protein